MRITPEDLVILSFPGPDRSITMADIAAGNAVSRRYRNRRIGEFMKELELTEGCSTGIRKIKRAISQNGSPDPVFETDDDRNYFLVRFPVHPKSVRQREAIGYRKEFIERAQGHDEAHVTGEVTGQVTGEVAALLRALVNTTLSRSMAQSALNLKSQANFRERYLEPALAEGWVGMTQPDSPRSPTQKYRLTAQGREILENLP